MSVKRLRERTSWLSLVTMASFRSLGTKFLTTLGIMIFLKKLHIKTDLPVVLRALVDDVAGDNRGYGVRGRFLAAPRQPRGHRRDAQPGHASPRRGGRGGGGLVAVLGVHSHMTSKFPKFLNFCFVFVYPSPLSRTDI